MGGLPKKKMTRLPKGGAGDSKVAKLASIFLGQSPTIILEQENIDPVSPLEAFSQKDVGSKKLLT
jgi:hypothetical protein